MADDIRIEITGDASDIKKVVKTADKLVNRFEKANSKATQRRVNKQKQAAAAIARGEERNAKRIAAMDRRLSRKRARNRLHQMKERIRIAKREARQEERIRKRSAAKMMKMAKFGAAGVGIGAGVGIIAGGINLVKDMAKYELTLRRLRNNSGMTAAAEAKLAETLDRTALATGAVRDKTLEMIVAIQQGSGVVLQSEKDVMRLAKLQRIMGEEQADNIGETLGSLQLLLKPIIDQLGGDFMPLFEDMIVVGNHGNFVIGEMAAQGGKLNSEFVGLGYTTRKGWKNFMAYAQAFRAVTGSGDAAVEKMKQFRTLIDTPAKRKLMEDAGIVLRNSKGELLQAHEMLQNTITWMAGGGDITALGLGEVGTFLKTMKGLGPDFKKLLGAAANTSGQLKKDFDGVQDTMDATLAIMGQLIKVLSQKAFKDFFKELSKGLNEFLGDKERMDEMVQNVKDFAEAMGMAARAVIIVAKIFRKHKLTKKDRIQISENVLNTGNKSGGGGGGGIFSGSFSPSIVVNNKVDAATGKTETEVTVEGQNNSDTGKQAYTTKK